MKAVGCFDQLSGYSNPVPCLSDAAFEDVFDVKPFSDFNKFHVLAAEEKRGSASRNSQPEMCASTLMISSAFVISLRLGFTFAIAFSLGELCMPGKNFSLELKNFNIYSIYFMQMI
jgi:hypothetical protein